MAIVERQENVYDIRKDKKLVKLKVSSDGRIYLSGFFTGFTQSKDGNIVKGGSVKAWSTSAERYLESIGWIKMK